MRNIRRSNGLFWPCGQGSTILHRHGVCINYFDALRIAHTSPATNLQTASRPLTFLSQLPIPTGALPDKVLETFRRQLPSLQSISRNPLLQQRIGQIWHHTKPRSLETNSELLNIRRVHDPSLPCSHPRAGESRYGTV